MFITNLNSNQRNTIDEMVDNIFRIYPNSYRYSNSSNYKTDSDEDGVTLTIDVPGYNKKLIDIFAVQDEIASSIVAKLDESLTFLPSTLIITSCSLTPASSAGLSLIT